MGERDRLLALIECYETAIRELYVMSDSGLLDLILRLERRRRAAETRLREIEEETRRVSEWVQSEIASAGSQAAA